tara:strand:+ start:2462 stop:2734 length:273 start_codon:yes stop_codon:yes gene_type:complete
MKFDPAKVRNGLNIRTQLEETPEQFLYTNSAVKGNQNPTTLDRNNERFAGYEGARAIELATNPQEAKRTDKWVLQYLNGNTPSSRQWMYG